MNEIPTRLSVSQSGSADDGMQARRRRLQREQQKLMAQVDALDGEIGDTLGVRDQLYYALKRIVRKYETYSQEPPGPRGCWIIVMLYMERHVDGRMGEFSPALSMPSILERILKLEWYRHEQTHGAQTRKPDGLRLDDRWIEAVRDIELPIVQHFIGKPPPTLISSRPQYSYSIDYAKAGEYLRGKFREDLLAQASSKSPRTVALAKPTELLEAPDSPGAPRSDILPLPSPAAPAQPHFLRIPIELRTIIYTHVLTHPRTGIHFRSARLGAKGHAYNAAADLQAQSGAADPFIMISEQRWIPETRANGLLGYYEILSALLCVNKQIYEESSPVFYANNFVFGGVTAFDKFLRTQTQAAVFRAANTTQPAIKFPAPITLLRSLTLDYSPQGKASAKHAFRSLALATKLRTFTLRFDTTLWAHYKQGGEKKYNYPRQYEGLRELCDSLTAMPAFSKLDLVGDCEDVAEWIAEEVHTGRSGGRGGLKAERAAFIEVSYNEDVIRPQTFSDAGAFVATK